MISPSLTLAESHQRLTALVERLRGLPPRKRVLAAIGFGLLGAAAFPPIDFAPILWVCFPALVILLQGCRNWKQAFFTGWGFSFGLLMLGLYWIAASMFVDIAHFWWAVPLSVAGLPAVFSIYYGVAMILAWRFGVRGFSGVSGAALLWFLADWTRGHAFSGFPWNLEGYAWSGILPMMQITSVIGVYGLTLLTLAAAFLPALCFENTKRKYAIVVTGIAVLAVLGVWGEVRLLTASDATVPNVRIRIVQPNVDQKHKWDADQREPGFQNLIALSSAPGEKPVTHVIWPESAPTFYLTEDAMHRNEAVMHLPRGSVLITGLVRPSHSSPTETEYHNSLIAFSGYGVMIAKYDKHHLVPFGEYMPYRSIFPLRPLIHLGVDFTPGPAAETLRVPGLPTFSPLICYEAIFTGDVTDQKERPHLLINVTNDAWYGDTAGPYQHFAMARTRAIEEGLPLIRAANTGISGVTDAYGRITTRLGLDIQGYTDADLPESLPPTFFVRNRHISLWIMFGALALIIISARFARKD